MAVNDLMFDILNAMMDDCEDLEQIYLAVNRKELMANGQPRILLVRIVDEVVRMLDEGLIEAQRSWDETVAPLEKPDLIRAHYYWFGPTAKGREEWRARRDQG